MTDADNPLLASDALPAFDRIAPAHVGPALDVLLRDAEAALERCGRRPAARPTRAAGCRRRS
jgi:oligopeptidase A